MNLAIAKNTENIAGKLGRLQKTVIKLGINTTGKTPVGQATDLGKIKVLGRSLVGHSSSSRRMGVPQAGVHAGRGQDVPHSAGQGPGCHALIGRHIGHKTSRVVRSQISNLEHYY